MSRKRLLIVISCFFLLVLAMAFSPQSVRAEKDTLNVALWTRVDSLDQWNSAMLVGMTVCDQIFDCLYTMDPETVQPVPNLALSHKLIDDTTWEFNLRQGVSFTNGEPFNTAAVKYTFERILHAERKISDRPT